MTIDALSNEVDKKREINNKRQSFSCINFSSLHINPRRRKSTDLSLLQDFSRICERKNGGLLVVSITNIIFQNLEELSAACIENKQTFVGIWNC